MHEGLVSLVLGLPGMPAGGRRRDDRPATSRLAEATGGRIHIMHVSSAGSVELIRRAKARGVRVTTEVCPHHFTLTDESLRTFDSNFKMNPPLRDRERRRGLHRRPGDGTIDCIATDHAPHAREKKMRELDQAPFGIVGLETALGLVVDQADRAGPSRLADGARQDDDQPGPHPGHRQRHARRRRRRRRHDHRPRSPAGPSIPPIPLQEHQHALRRLAAAGKGNDGDRRGRD